MLRLGRGAHRKPEAGRMRAADAVPLLIVAAGAALYAAGAWHL